MCYYINNRIYSFFLFLPLSNYLTICQYNTLNCPACQPPFIFFLELTKKSTIDFCVEFMPLGGINICDIIN
ncbi:hypothetical protein B9T16_07035 [Arthrospira sp. PCC 8006]